jgi:AraC-like DNA-binding protein/mannose-6-phosphate isomerase-like protein (cupin superfamily)
MAERTVRIGKYLSGDGPEIVALKTAHESVTVHDHDYFELVYISDGYCLHDMSSRMTLLMAGDLFIIPPGKSHRYMCNRDIKLFNCMFTAEAFRAHADKLNQIPGVSSLLNPNYEGFMHAHLELQERAAVSQLLDDMTQEFQKRMPGWDLLLESYLLSLIVHCGRIFQHHLPDVQEKRAYMGYVTQALKYIDKHYHEELTIHNIAEHIGVSNDYFSRQFKQVTGIAPVEYLRRYRFARAMELLADGLSVTDVSKQVGFKNLCHFSREFKNQLGVTPSQYRKQYAEQQLFSDEEEATGQSR